MPHLFLQARDNPKELLKFVALEGVAGENARSLFGDWLINAEESPRQAWVISTELTTF